MSTAAAPQIDLPNPVDGLAGEIVGAFSDWLFGGIAHAASSTFSELLAYLGSTTGAQLTHGWFATGRGRAVTATVSGLAGSILLLCLIFAIVQGVMAGEPAQAFRAALIEVPRAVLSAGALVMVAQLLLDMTDVASVALLRNAPADLNQFVNTYGVAANLTTLGAAGGVFAVVFFLGAALVWVELMVRAALIYFLVAASPIVFAARVWPEARPAYRRFIELGLALIFSKVAIALALALGAAGLGSFSTHDSTALGGLLSGAVLMIVAAMTPFVLLKLIPVVEGAVVAQGISRSPARAAQTGIQLGYYAQSMQRRSGAASGGEGAEAGEASAAGIGVAGGGGAAAGGSGGAAAGAAAGPVGAAIGAAASAGGAVARRVSGTAASAADGTAPAPSTGGGDAAGAMPRLGRSSPTPPDAGTVDGGES